MKDYYAILGVSREASQEEIVKRAEREDFYDVDTNFTPFSLSD